MQIDREQVKKQLIQLALDRGGDPYEIEENVIVLSPPSPDGVVLGEQIEISLHGDRADLKTGFVASAQIMFKDLLPSVIKIMNGEVCEYALTDGAGSWIGIWSDLTQVDVGSFGWVAAEPDPNRLIHQLPPWGEQR